MANRLWINGEDVEHDLGIRTTGFPESRAGFGASRETVRVPDGPVAYFGSATVEPRIVRLDLLVGSRTDSWSQRAAKLDELDALTGDLDSPITVRIGDQTGRRITGVYGGRTAAPAGPLLETMPGAPFRVSLSIACADPRWIATSATTLSSINATPRAITGAGTAEMDWTLTLSGGTDPVVTIRDHDGNTVGQMTLVGNFTGETVTIRGGKIQSIATTLDLSGASPYSLLANWDTEQWIRLRPAFWDGYDEDWADIAITGGGTGQLVYSPAWRA